MSNWFADRYQHIYDVAVMTQEYERSIDGKLSVATFIIHAVLNVWWYAVVLSTTTLFDSWYGVRPLFS